MNEQGIKHVETAFDRIFGCRCDEPLPVFLMRTAAKIIACTYPDNRHRTAAIERIIDAAGCLKQAEGMDQ